MPRDVSDLSWIGEGRWIDVVVSPKEPWDTRRPTARLVVELFDLRGLLPERAAVSEPRDDAEIYLFEKLKDARTVLDHLSQEAGARAEVHDETIREIDYQISKAASSLEQLTGGVGYNVGIDVKRNMLERELSNLRKDRRGAILRTWEDIARIRKDVREAAAEYRSLLGRLGML